MVGLTQNKRTFFFGSKSIGNLTNDVINQLELAITNNVSVIVGDCQGVDLAVQRYLVSRDYRNVTVYFSCDEKHKKPRNNIGGWATCACINDEAQELSGFEFRRLKDIAMIRDCDGAVCLWDGKSKGSQKNIEECHEKRIHVIQAKQ